MMTKLLLAVALVVVGSGFYVLTGQATTSLAVYTAAQAAAGRTAYQSSCVKCHTETLIPPADAKHMGRTIPPLAGTNFMARWGAGTTNDLFDRIKNAAGAFPPTDPGEKTDLNLTAYVLQVNGARPGTRELTTATVVVVETATAAP
jgi:mono/diheme cytochrome c family protein